MEPEAIADSLPDETRALLALHLVPGVGPRLTAHLLERFGSASAVLRASPARLREVPRLGGQLAEELAAALQRADVEGELALIARHRARLLALGTPEYPARLAAISDPPYLLYLRGTLGQQDAQAVALVGSRQCTTYGRRTAERLAAGLARAGCTVVSGLARGIDGAAHRGALEAGGRTLAVLAGGLARIYPPEHEDLARQVEAAGGLVCEAAMRWEPLAAMFPARNRLISGLSRAVVVVEAAERSGALITARHALDQGRDVFAVPGPIESPASAGTHSLLRQGATLIRGVEDILEGLEGIAPPRPGRQTSDTPAAPPALGDASQRRIWEFLADQPRHLDEMAQQLSLSVPQISVALLALEMQKVVRRLPGNRYERW